jgi:hypothetical protein
MEISFNINEYVHIKLNDSGIKELERQHEELRQQFPSVGEFNPPKVDEDGYSKFQMHDLMKRLGHTCMLGFEPAFDTNIKFCGA